MTSFTNPLDPGADFSTPQGRRQAQDTFDQIFAILSQHMVATEDLEDFFAFETEDDPGGAHNKLGFMRRYPEKLRGFPSQLSQPSTSGDDLTVQAFPSALLEQATEDENQFGYGEWGVTGWYQTGTWYGGTPVLPTLGNERVGNGSGDETSFVWLEQGSSGEAYCDLYLRVPDDFSSWNTNGIQLHTKVVDYYGEGTDPCTVTIKLRVYDPQDGSEITGSPFTRDLSEANGSNLAVDTAYVWLNVTHANLGSEFAAGDLLHIRIEIETSGDLSGAEFHLGELRANFEGAAAGTAFGGWSWGPLGGGEIYDIQAGGGGFSFEPAAGTERVSTTGEQTSYVKWGHPYDGSGGFELCVAVPERFTEFGQLGIRVRHKCTAGAFGEDSKGFDVEVRVFDPGTGSEITGSPFGRTITANDTEYVWLNVPGTALSMFRPGQLLRFQVDTLTNGAEYPTDFRVGEIQINWE